MKKYYAAASSIVVDRLTAGPEEAKEAGRVAWVLSFSENDNMKAVIERYADLEYLNICPTKKAAEELAAFWNECYKKNGTYAY